MNINAVSLVSSTVVPVFLGVLLIWVARRGQASLPFAMIFVLGGLVSFVFALAVSRLLTPVEALTGGAPASVRANLASAFLTAALPEELGRMVVSIGSIAIWRRLAERGVALTTAMIGLGFAMFENTLYSLTTAAGTAVIVERTVPTLSHAASALIMGALLQRAISKGRPWRIGLFLLALAVPCLLHGLYDFGAFMIEQSEFPDLPDEPTMADLKPLGPIFATMLMVTLVGLVELIWAGAILYGLRQGSSAAKLRTQDDTERSVVADH